jgi:hypothetical protein
MDRLFTFRLELHATGAAPWVESACAPSYTAAAARVALGEGVVLQAAGGFIPQFGGDNGLIVTGQSYVIGAHPPR